MRWKEAGGRKWRGKKGRNEKGKEIRRASKIILMLKNE